MQFRSKVFLGFCALVGIAYALDEAPTKRDDHLSMSDALLDAEIRRGLKTDGFYDPNAGKSKPAAPATLWMAIVDTLACKTEKSLNALVMLDVMKASAGVRNPASDASQTDCVSVPRGTRLAVDDWGGDTGIAEVRVRGADKRKMLSREIAIPR